MARDARSRARTTAARRRRVPMRHTDVTTAACGYWRRRGLPTTPGQVVTAPGAPLLLLALLAATGPATSATPGAVLLPRPAASWHAPPARSLGRPVHHVPVPAECGGVPDPFALLETVRRARAAGGDPRLLVVSVADDPTGTTVPPELLHEVCEAAVGEGLLVVSDETWRDTVHDRHGTVVVSPAEMVGDGHADSVVVLAGLDALPLPPGAGAGVARLPDSARGRALGARVREILAALHADPHGPDAESAAEALAEPPRVRERRAAGALRHGAFAAALHDAFTEAGALCRPPRVGRHLYADLEQSRARLAAHGVGDAAALEAELVRRWGPYAVGGHRFGDDPRGLRVRVSTEVLAARTPAAAYPGPAGEAGPPLRLPGVPEALGAVRAALADLLGAD
ncbi:aminotransferase class I/II-fold pyridoxal phosphate-dependent enzyme [Streptomyces sp. Z26]|uniref:aminotransferase class I/II-fold pyridoxal phosphate-dependent enzyme n=1 Tax=Streptomyces sp. Z26 TaxID=2500177 RepID=UPI0023E75EFE|nr:aminotransferase class I/II-fold pyridoxal phosphate-dependent enzyme [Streptomyces sp. Z26]